MPTNNEKPARLRRCGWFEIVPVFIGIDVVRDIRDVPFYQRRVVEYALNVTPVCSFSALSPEPQEIDAVLRQYFSDKYLQMPEVRMLDEWYCFRITLRECCWKCFINLVVIHCLPRCYQS